MDFHAECQRKEELLDLFWDLQQSERRELDHARKGSPNLKYDRVFSGLAVIEGIHQNGLRLVGDNGEVIKGLEITPRIRELLRPSDHLILMTGRRQGRWRLINLECIGTELDRDDQGSPQFHVSGMNPARFLRQSDLH